MVNANYSVFKDGDDWVAQRDGASRASSRRHPGPGLRRRPTLRRQRRWRRHQHPRRRRTDPRQEHHCPRQRPTQQQRLIQPGAAPASCYDPTEDLDKMVRRRPSHDPVAPLVSLLLRCGGYLHRRRRLNTTVPWTRDSSCQTLTRVLVKYEACPGEWCPPAGCVPAWNWTPPGRGLVARFDRVPVWVHIWYRLPWIDRFAYAWMWRHAGWDIVSTVSPDPRDGSGVREPRRPKPGSPVMSREV